MRWLKVVTGNVETALDGTRRVFRLRAHAAPVNGEMPYRFIRHSTTTEKNYKTFTPGCALRAWYSAGAPGGVECGPQKGSSDCDQCGGIRAPADRWGMRCVVCAAVYFRAEAD